MYMLCVMKFKRYARSYVLYKVERVKCKYAMVAIEENMLNKLKENYYEYEQIQAKYV